jgi:hypothetical protein
MLPHPKVISRKIETERIGRIGAEDLAMFATSFELELRDCEESCLRKQPFLNEYAEPIDSPVMMVVMFRLGGCSYGVAKSEEIKNYNHSSQYAAIWDFMDYFPFLVCLRRQQFPSEH